MVIKLDNTVPEVQSALAFGLLPENLPAPVSSRGICKSYENSLTYLVTKDVRGSLSNYNMSKRGGQRRLFSIPHPTFVHDEMLFFTKHWDELKAIFSRSPGSMSKPIFSSLGPRAVHITPHSELPRARLKAFSRFEYCAITDVARCYPSIYTHSIPWAINGRVAAKNDMNKYSGQVFGNRLDFVVRQAQDGQTIGLPIGPDTSKLVAEVVLSSVDAAFLRRYKKRHPSYIRHVDDYWIGGDTLEECELHLQNLRTALREHELDINDLKTRIVPVNRLIGDTWPGDFEMQLKRSFGALHEYHGYDPVSTLANIIDRASQENDDGIVKHALRVLDENKLWTHRWDILEHFLAHCAVHFPHSFDYIARVIVWRIRTEKAYDRNLWIGITSKVIQRSSSLGRDSESLWALWLARELKLILSRSLTDSVVDHNGALVLAFMAHMFSHGRTRDKDIGAKLAATVAGNPYSGVNWPLSLELNVLDIKGVDFKAYEGTEHVLKLLHEGGRSLVDWNAVPPTFVKEGGELDDEPAFAIEDFAFDYGDDLAEADQAEDA